MYQMAQGLALHGHQVHMVAVDDGSADPTPIQEFATVHSVDWKPIPNVVGALRTILHPRPYTQLKKEFQRFYDFLDRLHAREEFDVVVADEAHIARYGSYMKSRYDLPYILRCHNIEHEIYIRHLQTVRNPLMGWYLRLQTDRWTRFEIEEISKADASAAITSRDRSIIERLVPGAHVHTIPAAVDTDSFTYVPVAEREEKSLILLGNMAWPPNRDAAIWFSNQILPSILREEPDCVCYLIGGNPPLRQLPAPSRNFRIEGEVPDIRPYFNRATVGLIPLRVGGGMRVKMVEMMASGLPIVSTGQGAEGNEARPDRHYLLAESPEAFARATVQLLRDRGRRVEISEAARDFSTGYYSMREVSRKIEAMVQDVVDRKRNRVATQ
jgi:glycosyltransferase involved in cell wall biosynthesis